MKLWLLRHGHAEAHASSDAQRRLTSLGRQQVLHSAGHLLGRPLEAIISSPYVRARQTAELVAQALNNAQVQEVVPWLTPESHVREALAFLAARPEAEMLLVSHLPLIGEVAGMLVHGHRQSPMPMGTASLIGLEGDLPLAGAMQIFAQFHPQ